MRRFARTSRPAIADDETAKVRRTWDVIVWRVARGLLTQTTYWRFLLDRRHRERHFGLTVARLWLAYRTGALRYGILIARRPAA